MPLTLPHTLTAGTNENVGDVQDNFEEVANAFPVQAANIGDAQVTTAKIATGAITPHKYFTVAHVSAVTSHTFSGLSGDADYGYEIYLAGVTGTGTDGLFVVQPNAITTGFHVSRHQQAGVSGEFHTVDAPATTGLKMGSSLNTVCSVQMRASFFARTGHGNRTMISHSVMVRTSDAYKHNETLASHWTDTTTNVTSLKIDIVAAFTGIITLRKLGEV